VFEASRIAKLAPALASGDRFLVVEFKNRVLTIAAVGSPSKTNWLTAEDNYPRVRGAGPGVLVFYRGASAAFRYRAGVVDELQPNFFHNDGEPAKATRDIAALLFAHNQLWQEPTTVDLIRVCLAELVDKIAKIGHGGVLAILAREEAIPTSLIAACDYPLVPVNAGVTIVDAYESELVMDSIGKSIMGPGPDYLPVRPLTKVETESDAWRQTAKDRWTSLTAAIAGMAAVDGAVLMTAKLEVLGFGCTLPGILGDPPTVLKPACAEDDPPVHYDLTKRGTRHSSAAQFAQNCPGRLAFVVSEDGHSGCFMWSAQNNTVMYWPVHVGMFESVG
jgi:hypothetical protein